MYSQKTRRTGAWMVIFSICLRLFLFLGLDAKAAAFLSEVAKNREFARWMLFFETGKAVTLPEEQEELFVLQIEPAAQAESTPPTTEPQSVTPSIPSVPAEAITVTGACTYSRDTAALLARPSCLDFSKPGPHILIVHTHGSEAYTPATGSEYQPTTAYRTLDTDRSVIRVGAVVAETLKQAGYSVIHDQTINDHPSFNNAYWNTLRRIEQWKAQYPNLQIILDIHRDAAEDENGNPVALSATAEGQDCARLMLVVGTNQGGLPHPNWQENLANALKLQSVLDGAYPGLCRSIDLRTERFNQHTAPGAILVEVGTHGNTLPQALAAAELLGKGLAAMLTAIENNGGVLQ